MDQDIVFDGQASQGGVYVTVTVRVEPSAQYPDIHEFGEEVGARAAQILARVHKAKPVPF